MKPSYRATYIYFTLCVGIGTKSEYVERGNLLFFFVWVMALLSTQGSCNVDSSAHNGWEGNPPGGFPVQTNQGG